MKVRDFIKKVKKQDIECTITARTSSGCTKNLIVSDSNSINLNYLDSPLLNYDIAEIHCYMNQIVLDLKPVRQNQRKHF